MASPAAAPVDGGECLSVSRSDHHFLRTLPWEKKYSGDGSFSNLVAKTRRPRRPSNDESVTLQGSSSYLQGSSCGDNESLTVQLVGWDGDASMDLHGLVLPHHWEDQPHVEPTRRQGSRREPLTSSLHKSQLEVPQEESDSDSDANTFAEDEYGSDSDDDVSDLSHSQGSQPAVAPDMEPDRKRVQFGFAHVREYRVILDAPATCRSQVIAGEARLKQRRRRRPTVSPEAGACSLTLDWSHAPVDFVYPALALGYQSYFSNRPCGIVKDKRLRLCQLNDFSFEELRLHQSRAIARRVADLILESADWPLLERPQYPDADDLPSGSRWETGAAQDGPPVNLRAASLATSWRRESPTPDRLQCSVTPPAQAVPVTRQLRRFLMDYVSLPRSGLALGPL